MFKRFSPAQVLVTLFVVVILLGTCILYLPWCHNQNAPHASLLNCLFTATSAICVTGLSVYTLSDQFSLLGQTVIMILFQLGGLGYITIASLLAVVYGKLPLKEKLVLDKEYNQHTFEGIKRFTIKTALVVFGFECIGFAIMLACFLPSMALGPAVFHALFHAISSFCNVGFSSFPNGLEGFTTHLPLLVSVTMLSLIGGLGYVVLFDMIQYRQTKKLSLHTKTVLVSTGIVIIIGPLLLLLAEYHNPATMGSLSVLEKVVNSFFMGASARTSGFNSVSTASLTSFSLFLLILLMFIGGGPASTAGGIKVTTLWVVLSTIWATLRRHKDTTLFWRRIDEDSINKACTVISVSVAWICLSTIMVLATQDHRFIEVVFECVSAFGIVGLSMGITPELTPLSKLIIIISMLLGRLGPLTIGIAVLRSAHDTRIRYPQESVFIG